jgi:hypothetical protein
MSENKCYEWGKRTENGAFCVTVWEMKTDGYYRIQYNEMTGYKEDTIFTCIPRYPVVDMSEEYADDGDHRCEKKFVFIVHAANNPPPDRLFELK